jgi:hypothetical protein
VEPQPPHRGSSMLSPYATTMRRQLPGKCKGDLGRCGGHFAVGGRTRLRKCRLIDRERFRPTPSPLVSSAQNGTRLRRPPSETHSAPARCVAVRLITQETNYAQTPSNRQRGDSSDCVEYSRYDGTNSLWQPVSKRPSRTRFKSGHVAEPANRNAHS